MVLINREFISKSRDDQTLEGVIFSFLDEGWYFRPHFPRICPAEDRSRFPGRNAQQSESLWVIFIIPSLWVTNPNVLLVFWWFVEVVNAGVSLNIVTLDECFLWLMNFFSDHLGTVLLRRWVHVEFGQRWRGRWCLIFPAKIVLIAELITVLKIEVRWVIDDSLEYLSWCSKWFTKWFFQFKQLRLSFLFGVFLNYGS